MAITIIFPKTLHGSDGRQTRYVQIKVIRFTADQ